MDQLPVLREASRLPPLPDVPTEWFPATVDPVWPGTYDVEAYRGGTESPDVERWTWTGEHWRDTLGTRVVLHPKDQWRGRKV